MCYLENIDADDTDVVSLHGALGDRQVVRARVRIIRCRASED